MNMELGQVWVSKSGDMPDLIVIEILEHVVCGESVNKYTMFGYNELVWIKKEYLIKKYELRRKN